MSGDVCPDSLVTRARMGTITAAERRQLDLHLTHCESCRLTLQLGYDFDQVLGEQPGDELLAARIAAAVTRVPQPARSGRRFAVAAAVLLLVSASAVAAGPRLVRAWQARRAPVVAPTPAPPAAAPPRTPAAPIAQPEPSVEPQTDDPAVPPAAEDVPAPSAPPRPSHRPRATVDHPAPTADELFATANARRRAGDVPGARAAYLELQRRHPTSSPAIVSRVSLGRLFLDRLHDPKLALAQFDTYLAQSTHTALTEEALYGRATALLRLGRVDEERATWQRLMVRFPTSVYSERAASRLEPKR